MSTSLHDVETQPFARPYTKHHRVASGKHFVYLLLPQGLGAALISGLVNLGIACAMYRTVHGEIRIWPLNKHTIAGDLGVTIIIQSILSTLIASLLVRADVHAKRQKPFYRPWPDVDWWRGQEGVKKWFGLALCFFSLDRDLLLRKDARYFFRTLVMIALQGFAISFLYFLVFWPLAIAIIAPLYSSKDLHDTWIPPVIKAIFGALLALFQNPLLAALVLGAEAHNPSTPNTINSKFNSIPVSPRPPMIQTTTNFTSVLEPARPDPTHLPPKVQS